MIMRKLEIGEMSEITGGLDCGTKAGLGVGLIISGVLLGFVTLGTGFGVALMGAGAAIEGFRGVNCTE